MKYIIYNKKLVDTSTSRDVTSLILFMSHPD